MATTGESQKAAELARLWALGFSEAIRSETQLQSEAAVSESSRQEAAKTAALLVNSFTLKTKSDAILSIAIGTETLAALIGSTSGAALEDEQRNQKWQQLLERAAGRLRNDASDPAGAFTAGPTAAAELPAETALFFAIELIIANEKMAPFFLAFSPALLKAWQPEGVPAPLTLDLLLDVELPLSISFGHTYLPVRDILKLSTGSIVELNCAANEFVDVIVNNCTIARGEVVVIEGNYGVRIDEIISRSERMQLQHNNGLSMHRPMRITA